MKVKGLFFDPVLESNEGVAEVLAHFVKLVLQAEFLSCSTRVIGEHRDSRSSIFSDVGFKHFAFILADELCKLFVVRDSLRS